MNIVGDLDRLVASFERHLKAENKAVKTVQTYRESVLAFTSYLALPTPRTSGRSTSRTS